MDAAGILNSVIYLSESDRNNETWSAAAGIPCVNDALRAAEDNQESKNGSRNVEADRKASCGPGSGKAVVGAKKVSASPSLNAAAVKADYANKAASLKGKSADSLPGSEPLRGSKDLPYDKQLFNGWRVPMQVQEQEEPPYSENEDINKWWKKLTESVQPVFICYPKLTKTKIFIRLGHDIFKNNCYSGADGVISERIVADEVGFSLAEEFYKYGYDVKVYRSRNGTFGGKKTKKQTPAAVEAVNAGIKEANEWGANLFISCHANSSDNKNLTGSLVLYNTVSPSQIYAQAVYETIYNSLKEAREAEGIKTGKMNINKGAIKGNVNEMFKTTMPGILLEPIFVSNKSECKAYNQYTGRQLGIDIANCIRRYVKN